MRHGFFSFPDKLTAILHDEQPEARYGYLNGRCSDPVVFFTSQTSVRLTATRKCHPTHVTFWHGGECMVQEATLGFVVDKIRKGEIIEIGPVSLLTVPWREFR